MILSTEERCSSTACPIVEETRDEPTVDTSAGVFRLPAVLSMTENSSDMLQSDSAALSFKESPKKLSANRESNLARMPLVEARV